MRLSTIPCLLAVTFFCGCRQEANPKAVPSPRSQEEKTIPEEAQARKARSIAILKKEGVPFIDHLPVIESEAEAKRRTTKEVALRAIALCIVAVKGEGLEQEEIDKLVEQFAIADALTPNERRFIHNADPSKHERIQFAWRYECYWVMLWALGFVDDLARPDAICDVRKAVLFLRDSGRESFVKRAKLRSAREILDAADLIYRYHWAVTEARVKNQEPPAGLNPGVVLERHYALNWLVGYADQEWDDISTDT
ncbi:MAG TPA: DUF4272 domain-containing protein [Gemmataceae bacterium]|jgi:hypothetical protein|nr:DUF4272 domain-containing protein [Gemmataceae bacterium]